MEAVVASASYDELRAAVVSQDRDGFWEIVHRDERLGRELEEAANEVWEASDPFKLAEDYFPDHVREEA